MRVLAWPKVVQPREESLDSPTFSVAAQCVAIIECCSTAALAVGSNQDDIFFQQLFAQWITVIGAVSNQAAGRRR
jgi:hypothetical protein